MHTKKFALFAATSSCFTLQRNNQKQRTRQFLYHTFHTWHPSQQNRTLKCQVMQKVKQNLRTGLNPLQHSYGHA